MHLSGLSIVYLLIAFLIFWNNEKLLLATIFFAPFTESFVFSTGSWNLKPGHFFLLLFLINCTLVSFRLRTVAKPKLWSPVTAFVIVSLMSIIVSAIFKIDVPVYGIGNGVQLKSSLVSSQNFTQFLYVFTGWLLYICIYNYCIYKPQFWNKLIKCMFLSSCTIMMIGIYQIIAYSFHLPYDEIFRQTAENGVKNMWQTKARVAATFGEASFFGQYCTFILAIYLYLLSSYKKKKYYFWIFGLIVLGVFSRSTTFLIGTAAVIITYVMINSKTANKLLRHMMIFVALIIFGVTAYLFIPRVNDLITVALEKFALQNHSGEERFSVSVYMLYVGLKYPILGIGFGGGRALNLYSGIFATTGIVGSVCWWGYIISLLYNFRKMSNDKVKLCVLLLIGFLVTSISIPDINDLTLWIILGLCESCRYMEKNNKLFILEEQNDLQKTLHHRRGRLQSHGTNGDRSRSHQNRRVLL